MTGQSLTGVKGSAMNLTATSTLETAVAKGAAYLDGRYPGWRWRIQADMIEPGCQEHSIPGQLFGDSIVDQLRGVGLNDISSLAELAELDAASAARQMVDFCAMGFATMVHTPYYPSDLARAEALTQGIELPDVIPVPRDQDVCFMELETLTVLWEREVAKR